MSEQPRLGVAGLSVALIILALAAGARFLYLSSFADMGRNSGPIQIQEPPPNWGSDGSPNELASISKNLLDQNEFKSEAPFSAGQEVTAHTSPGYPYFYSLMGRFFGDGQDQWTRWFQWGLGSLTALLYFLFAWRAFRSRLLATIAGALTALNPYSIISTVEINDGALASFFLALALWLGIRAVQTGGPLTSVIFGIVLAGLGLIRAPLLGFGFIALIWFLWRCRTVELGWLCALLAFLGFIFGLSPWTLRNFLTYQGPVPIVNSAYLHMWMGNNPDSDGGPQARATLEAALKKVDGLTLAELQATPQQERYRQLGRPMLQYISDHPHRFTQNRMTATISFLVGSDWLKDRRVARTVTGAEPMPAWLQSNYQAILNGVILGMLLLAFLGWRWTYVWNREIRLMTLALIWIPIPYILSHGSALHGARLPLDGVLLTFSAYTLTCFWPATARKLFAGSTPVAQEEVSYGR